MRKNRSSSRKRPAWAAQLAQLGGKAVAPARQAAVLRASIAVLAEARLPKSRAALVGQPFDGHLLALSPLYARSRAEFLRGGGSFVPALVSSPRSLSSPILLTQAIEYSPIASELVWAARDSRARRDSTRLLELRTYTSSLFHEQSHRLLWRLLPRPARGAAELRRYLNFVESLVVTLDMALGDELGPELARAFYLSGALYDPGTPVRQEVGGSREYRNYLQVCLHATYLNLEMYDPERIPEAMLALFPMMEERLVERAVTRALRLDRGFVTRTNPEWQRRHRRECERELARLPSGRGPWSPPEDPMDNREQYLWGEEWLGRFQV